MADNSVITNLEMRVQQLLEAHHRRTALCEELKQASAELKQQNRRLEEENRTLRSELSRKELAEGLSGRSSNRERARARVNRLMREVDKCIALVGSIEDAASRGTMNEAK